MKKLIPLSVAAAAITLASMPAVASAATYTNVKTHQVSEVTVWTDGALTVDLADGSTNNYFLCYVDKPLSQAIPGTTITNSLNAETCQAWQALATAAQLSGRPLTIQWYVASDGAEPGERSLARIVKLGK